MTGAPAGRRNLLTKRQASWVGEAVLREIDVDGRLAARPAILRTLLRAWDLSRQWRISTTDLESAAFTPDNRLFAEWARRFDTRCRDRGWIDAASLSAVICADLADGNIELPGPLHVAGFDRPTAAEAQLLATLAECRALGGRIVHATTTTNARRVRCADPASEFARAARWARSTLQQQPDALIGIVVPDLPKRAPDVRRRFLNAFDARWRCHADADHPVQIDDGARLIDAGLVHTALLLLELPDARPDFRDIGQLLRSPYIAGADVEAAARAELDLRLRDRKFQRIQPDAIVGESRAPEFAKRVGRVLDMRTRIRGQREPAEWIVVIDELLKCAGWPQGRGLAFDEEQQLAAWQRSLQQSARLGEVTGAVSFRDMRRLLRDMLQDEPLRETRGGLGVQILSPWDAAGQGFDGLWVAGLSSATWPPAPLVNPLIPASLLRDRGVPEAMPDVYRDAALAALDQLIEDSSAAVCSWSDKEGEEELVPSPFLDRMPDLAPDAVAALDARPDFSALILASARQETLSADAAPAISGAEQSRGGSRTLSLQSSCPARAFFEVRLGAREMTSPPFALDAVWRGNLTHDALELLYRRFVDVVDPFRASAATLDAAIETAINESLARHIPRQHPLAQTLRANEKSRLDRLLRNMVEIDRARGAFVVAGLECEHEAEIGPLTLKLRFDRVDRLADGRQVVFDYKTGREKSLSVWRGNRPQEPQLPLYAAGGHAAGVGFIWLQSADVKISGVGAPDLGIDQLRGARGIAAAQWPTIVEGWELALGRLADEYARGDCRIDLDRDRDATGEFAMLTRRYELRWSEEE